MRSIKLLNQPKDCVREAIEGILLSTSNIIALENENVLFRSDINVIKDKEVILLSGGGSGHEPAHAGYIGNGMLSGAILGNVFASPSVNSILAAIRVAAGRCGVLLIVKNYTGDRLNFGIAAQRAKSEGIQVEMVLVDDDCALPKGKGITGRRGVAGTIFVHKIAGAAAQRGCSLMEVKSLAMDAISRIGTLGAALSLCSVPGSKSTRLIPENSIEMAIGIHGEPGRIQILTDHDKDHLSESLSSQILDQILDQNIIIAPNVEKEVALLVNNLGGISQLELLVFLKDIIKSLQLREIKVTRCYSGSFMTSLEMAGVSVTIFHYNSQLLSLLDETTTAPAWIPSSLMELSSPIESKKIPSPLPPSPPSSSTSSAPSLDPLQADNSIPCPASTSSLLVQICEILIQNEPILTQYDQICGDGDCGLTIKAGAQHILQQLQQQQSFHLTNSSIFFTQLAVAVSESMGGTFGILLEIFFHAISLSLKEQTISFHQNPKTQLEILLIWSNALQTGIDSICFYGGANEGMRTLLDSLIPAASKFHQLIRQSPSSSLSSSPSSILSGVSNLDEIFCEVTSEAKKGMERTKTLLSVAGRSNYISQEILQGTPDPGAYAVFLIFQTIYQFYQQNRSS